MSGRDSTLTTGTPGGRSRFGSERDHLLDRVELVVGVDTHKHTHTAAAVSATGGVLGELFNDN